VSALPRVPFDTDEYTRAVRSAAADGSCFICAIVAGTSRESG
jgi:hypothetical protein